jgi:hypothetical protein
MACRIGRPDEDDQRADHRLRFVGEDRVVTRLGARRDATPDGELRGDLTVLAVPGREDAKQLRIFGGTGGGEEVLHGIGAEAEGATNVRACGASGGELRDVLERDAVDAVGLAEIAAPRAEGAEAEVGLVARRIERERLHVTAERDVVLARELVGLRNANELEGARRRSPRRRQEQHEREEDGREPAHAIGKRSAILEDVPPVDVLATVRCFPGASEVQSPVSDARGLVVHLEVLDGGETLGHLVLGDAIELHADDGARYVVMARRATFGFVNVRQAKPLDAAPAELVPLLVRSRGGSLSVREHVVRSGDRLRLRAQVEAGLVRADDGPVRLDEVI